MLKLNILESRPDLVTFLDPKKRIYELVQQVNGSMLNFHKIIKTSKEIEALAADYFKIKQDHKLISDTSNIINIKKVNEKIHGLKAFTQNHIEFI